jgi:hypothetical protein
MSFQVAEADKNNDGNIVLGYLTVTSSNYFLSHQRHRITHNSEKRLIHFFLPLTSFHQEELMSLSRYMIPRRAKLTKTRFFGPKQVKVIAPYFLFHFGWMGLTRQHFI